jgi:hypothetical protein
VARDLRQDVRSFDRTIAQQIIEQSVEPMRRAIIVRHVTLPKNTTVIGIPVSRNGTA